MRRNDRPAVEPEGDGRGERGTLYYQNPEHAKGWTQVANLFLDESPLDRHAKLLYIYLKRHAGEKDTCFPGYELLCNRLGCGRRDLAKWIRELVVNGYIEVKRRGQGKTSIYVILDLPEIQKFQDGTTRSSKTQKFQSGTTRSSSGKTPSSSNGEPEEDSVEKDSIKNEIPADLVSKIAHALGIRNRTKVLQRLASLDADPAALLSAAETALRIHHQSMTEEDFWRFLTKLAEG